MTHRVFADFVIVVIAEHFVIVVDDVIVVLVVATADVAVVDTFLTQTTIPRTRPLRNLDPDRDPIFEKMFLDLDLDLFLFK